MQMTLIGEYEVTLQPDAEPALVLHHLIRGHDVVRLPSIEARAVAGWLSDPVRRIRELNGYRLIVGAAGDVTWYLPNGLRAAYLNSDQAARLVDLLTTYLPSLLLGDDDVMP